jgi:Ca2+-binding RTX toxin-like protein
MWILLGLIGALLAGGFADLLMRADPQDPDTDSDPAENAADDIYTDNLLDYAPGPDLDDGLGAGDWTPGPTPDLSAPDLPADMAPDLAQPNPFLDDPADADISGLIPDDQADWHDDGLDHGWDLADAISTDLPDPPVEGVLASLPDAGGTLLGGDGDDTLLGGAGLDWIEGGAGNDWIDGGAGHDTLFGGAGQNTIQGGMGDDHLYAGNGAGLLLGGEGNDLLTGGAFDDTLFGGAGDDTLVGGWGNDLLIGGGGGNLLMGGAGDDTLIGAITPDQMHEGLINFLNGGDGDDVLVLGGGDFAHGGAGRDTFILGDWLSGLAPAMIADFDPLQDQIALAHDALTDPQIQTQAGAEGIEILLNGAVVAILSGIDSFDPALILRLAVSMDSETPEAGLLAGLVADGTVGGVLSPGTGSPAT